MSLREMFVSTLDSIMLRREERLQQIFGQTTRVIHFRQPQRERPVALFGSNPNEAFGLDWANYRVSQPRGPGTQPLQAEMKVIDSDIDAWKGPNPDLPSLTSHGKRLDYSRSTDQQPIKNFSSETLADRWDGKVSNVVKKSMESSRPTGKTVGDEIAESWNKVETYDFRG